MKKGVLCIAFLLGLMLYMSLASAVFDFTDWAYQDTVIITENSGTALSNYSVRLNLPFQEGMNSDFSDIRFADLNDNELGYWVEKKTDNDEIVVWVKVPSLPANQKTTIKMYFGDASAESASSMENTFKIADPAGFKSNWKYYGYKSGRYAGWEDALRNFTYAGSWKYVDISADYVPTCPPDSTFSGGLGGKVCSFGDLPDNIRWFVRKEFFMKQGVFYYSGSVDDDEVWSLVNTDNTIQKIGGDEMDNDGHNTHSWSIRQVTVPEEGRYIFAGRGKDGSGGEYLKITAIAMSTNIIYYRDPATKEPTAELKPSTWWNTGWMNKREIVINNTSSAIYNYTLMIDINTLDLENANADYSDLRFTNELETGKLNYWIEKNNGINIWVKVPEITPGLNRIFMYYNNPGIQNESSLENTFKKAGWNDFKSNWKYSGYQSGRVAGWENQSINFSYADSSWKNVDISTDYIPTCPPDKETSGGFPPRTDCWDEAPNNVRWFVRKEFLFKPGDVAFNAYHDDDEVWSLISINNAVQKIGGDEMDANGGGVGSSPHAFSIKDEGRFVWAGRGQEGSGDERLDISTAVFDNIYLRTVASPEPKVSVNGEQEFSEGIPISDLTCEEMDCAWFENEADCQSRPDCCEWTGAPGNKTCISILDKGALYCDKDGIIDAPYEECDPGCGYENLPACVGGGTKPKNLSGQNCLSRGYPAGTLSCTQECAFNTDLCGSRCRQEQDDSFWVDTGLSSKENCSVEFDGQIKECCPNDETCANVFDENNNEFNVCIKTGVSRCSDYTSEKDCSAFDWSIAKDSVEEVESAGFLCEQACGTADLPCNFTNCICGWDEMKGCVPKWELIEINEQGNETLGDCTYTPVEGECNSKGFKPIEYTASPTGGVIEGCEDKVLEVPCFAATEVPFFGVWSLMITIAGIIVFYIVKKE